MVEIGESETTNNYLPSYSYYKQALTQQIYTAEEIGTAGTIKSIAFYNEATAARTRSYDFYLKATDKSSFSSNTDWITVSATDKVFSGSVTMTAGAWTTIFFDTPFEYDGISNLVLVADDNTGSYDNQPYMACSVYNTDSNQAIYIYSDYNDYNPMSPPTSGSSIGGGSNNVLTVKNHIILGIESDTDEEQTISLAQGWNWWSTNLDITLADLKAALVEALPNGSSITIKSQLGSTTWNGTAWRGTIEWDVTKMFKIQVSSNCQITLTGTPLNPAEHPVTIKKGNNWIGFPLSESSSLNEAFGSFPVAGDIVKSKTGSSTYTGNGWRTPFNLEPGKGYIYQSVSNDNRTFLF